MRLLPCALAIVLALPIALHAQLSVGESSKDTPFTVFDSSGDLQNAQLSSESGKVIVAFYFTPW